jgi:hypothetical protein
VQDPRRLRSRPPLSSKIYQLCSLAEDNRARDIVVFAQPNRAARVRGRGQYRGGVSPLRHQEIYPEFL